ncbi:hypothetical protein [Flavobacterium sp. F52]|uniref:hypothetical protein n=1 Tax=Flavobacterium sp. F52 TaxID=1202532 RepID=UPI000272DF7C|nr:hypothetical protein [Flavobacterium sp. F52]EJG03405.1 hypothetical protein FF52_00610 [Flavobacterium sp. F52]
MHFYSSQFLLQSTSSELENKSLLQNILLDNSNSCQEYYTIDLSSNYFFIYDVLNKYKFKEENISDITRLLQNNDDNITTDIPAQLALFFLNRDLIKIPSKVEYVIRKYISKKLLKEIHSDLEVAIELCLLLLSQLSSTYFGVIDGTNPEGWKSLKAKFLRNLLSIHPTTYKKVITALMYPLKKGAILECDNQYQIGEKNYYYRLGKPFLGKGIIGYELRTKEAKLLLNKYYITKINEAQSNPICKNLMMFYSDITLPSIDEIKKEANRLIKLGYTTNKGKRLIKLNKHSRKYFKNFQTLSFVEDSIEIFSYLTDNGLLIPTVGNNRSGGRIVDSFTLMPSWIRRLVKIKGKHHVECDYNCLHPNIAIQLYGGTISHLTHSDIGLALKIETNAVKIEHLSFFNKEVWQMKQSKLFKYYQQNEPKMLQNIIEEKYNSPYRHKITSRKLFAKEVEIMSDVIQQLNQENIYVGYIYDALFCHPQQANRMKEIMDKIVQKYKIQTTAKLSSDKKYNSRKNKLNMSNINLLSQNTVTADSYQSLRIDAKLINFGDRVKTLILEKIEKGQHLNFENAEIIFGTDDIVNDKVLKIYDEFNPNAMYVMKSYLNPPS